MRQRCERLVTGAVIAFWSSLSSSAMSATAFETAPAPEIRAAAAQSLAARADALRAYDVGFRQSDGGGNPLSVDTVLTTLRVRPTGYAIRVEHIPGMTDHPGIAKSSVQFIGAGAMESAAIISASVQQARVIDPRAEGFEHEMPRANKCLPSLFLPPIPGVPSLFDPYSAVASDTTEVAAISWEGVENAVELRWTSDHAIVCRMVIDTDRQGLPLLVDYGGVEIRTLEVGTVSGIPFPVKVAGAHPETWAAIDAGTIGEPAWRWTIELVEADLAGMAEPPLDPTQSAVALVPVGYTVSDFIVEEVYVAGSERPSSREATQSTPVHAADASASGGIGFAALPWGIGVLALVATSFLGVGLCWRRWTVG
jgi:hypothetical protein